MVTFSVFNELSLPLDTHSAKDKFGILFKLLEQLRDKGLNQIRMSNDFKNYYILENTTFQDFLGQQERDFKTRLVSFVNNSIIKIDSPIIYESEEEQIDVLNSCEYHYKGQSTKGGLACADIWSALSISFNSNTQWNENNIVLKKTILSPDSELSEQDVNIKHASKIEHLTDHNAYFVDLDKEIKSNINQKTFWKQKDDFFSDIIVFCPEVERQIQKLDKRIFDIAISILRNIETKQKTINDFTYSKESSTVSQDPRLKQERMFTVDEKKVFFEKHVKKFPSGNRLYFLEKEDKIHIGYIGKHLRTAQER